jgi:hypothetical protein
MWRLEAECHRNIELIWLLGGLKPDFKTIADFRSDNRAAFRSVFRAFVVLCRRLDLFGCELIAVDGTRIKPSTTRIATSPSDRWKSLSRRPTRSSAFRRPVAPACSGSSLLASGSSVIRAALSR